MPTFDQLRAPGITTPILVGKSLLLETGGWRSEWEWEGTESDCKGKIPELRAQGWSAFSVTRVGDSPLFRLRASYGGDPETPDDDGNGNTPELNAAVEKYELVVNQLQQHVLVNPIVLATIGDAGVWALKARYNEFTRGEATIEATRALVSATLGEYALGVFDDMVAGNDQWLNFSTVFRRTTWAANRFDLSRVTSGYGKIWTLQQVEFYEDLANLPANMPFALPATGTWLRLPAEIISQSQERTVATYEYWNAYSWNARYYSPVDPSIGGPP